MERKNEEETLHCEIRSVLQSHKGGMPLRQLERDFYNIIGRRIPYNDHGYHSLEAYLESIPSVVYLYRSGGFLLVEAVADDSTVHIANLVERQKTSKKKRVKLRPSMRRPIMTKSNYRSTYYDSNSSSRPKFSQPSSRPAPQQRSFGVQSPTENVRKFTPSKPTKVVTFARTIQDGAPSPSKQKIVNSEPVIKPTPKKSHQLYEPPPRFTKSLSYSVKGMNQITTKKPPTYKQILEEYAAAKNLGCIVFKTLSLHMEHRLIQVATVKVKDKTFSSYPDEHTEVGAAEEAAARNAVNALGLQNADKKCKKKVSSDIHTVFMRIREILDSHPNGIINTQVPIEYAEKFNETLPYGWQDLLIQNEMISTEKCDEARLILYPFISPYKFENGAGKTNSDTSNSSDSLVPNTHNAVDNQPKISQLCLPDDNTWDVFVTYVISTNHIAVRLVGESYSEKYEDLANNMDIYYSERNRCIPAKNVEEGKFYACKIDESWHRIEINMIIDSKALCTFIDHGDSEYITLSDIYVLHDQFQTLPKQVVHCYLSGLEDYSEDTHGFVFLMENILGQTLVAEIVSREEPITVSLYDTTTDEDININEKLISFLDDINTSKFSEEGKISEVELTHITDAGEVYVQPKGRPVQSLNDALGELLERTEEMPAPDSVSNDKMYIAKYTLDSNWYRATVLKHSQGEAVKCNLHQLPPTAMKWTPEAIDKLHELTANAEGLLMKIAKVANNGGAPSIELFKRLDNNEIVSINQTLVLDDTVFKKEVTSSLASDLQKLEVSSTLDGSGDASSVSSADEVLSLMPPFIPENGSTMDVHVTMAVSPWNFVCQPWRNGIARDYLVQNMDAYYRNEKNRIELKREDVIVGKLFACLHHKDRLWYRVQVKGKDRSSGLNRNVLNEFLTQDLTDKVSVQFVDFGDTVIVSGTELQPLAMEFYDLPYQAIFCKLSGIEPKNGDWQPEDCVRFQTLVVEKEFVAIVSDKTVDSVDGISLELELIDVSNPLEDTNIARILVEECRAKLL